MRLLWVVTKAPWPPIDGGRLVVAQTLAALAGEGHEIDLVAPYAPGTLDPGRIARELAPACRAHLVPVAARGVVAAVLASTARRLPLSIARHDHAPLRARVAVLLSEQRYDAVHAEQLQALAACMPALARGVPVVLRCQNVESDLWRGFARSASLARPLALLEARRLARHEGRALRRATTVLALTSEDAARLAEIAGGIPVEAIAAPFPARLQPGTPRPAARPAVATLGSSGWRPSEDGVAWLVREVWPAVRASLPGAVLHVFGDAGAASAGVERHPAPTDSREAFPAGAVCVVPLRYGSGVRMRILEAWARGLPVVATPEAVHGLGTRNGRDVLLARTPGDFATALGRLATEPALAEALVTAGRVRLRAGHAPKAIAERLGAVYREAAQRARDSAP